MEEEICQNYLSHHQTTHRHANDQSLGLSYHARLCDYRILPYIPKSKDSKPKGMQIRIPRNILIHHYLHFDSSGTSRNYDGTACLNVWHR